MAYTRKKYNKPLKSTIIIKSRDKLFNKLRQQRKKSKYNKIGGGAWEWVTSKFSQSSPDQSSSDASIKSETFNDQSNNITNKLKPAVSLRLNNYSHDSVKDFEEKVQQRVENLYEVSKNANSLSVGVNVAIPFLAASGVGLPLAGALYLAKQLSDMYIDKLQLKMMFIDLILILENCYFLDKLIQKTNEIFNLQLKNISEGIIITLDESLQHRILDKINLITKLLASISSEKAKNIFLNMFNDNNANAINDDRYFAKFRSKMDRMFNSKFYKEIILRELSILNSLFILYNSKFDWIIQFYEKKINIKDPNIVTNIWDEIEKTNEFKNYLKPPSNIDSVLAKDFSDLQKQDPKKLQEFVQNGVNMTNDVKDEDPATIVEVTEATQASNTNADGIVPNTNTILLNPETIVPNSDTIVRNSDKLTGGNKSKKNKKRLKHKTRKHKRK